MVGNEGGAAERGAEVGRAGQTAAGDATDYGRPHKGYVY